MTIGERIYKLRSSLKLSQKEFADKIGVAQSSVNYWENGNREPKVAQLKKISEKFNIPLDSLLGFPIPKNATIWEDPNGEKMISTVINPDDLRLALDMDAGMRNIYADYKKLNDEGKKIAVERVSELTNVEKYTLLYDRLFKTLQTMGIENLEQFLATKINAHYDISPEERKLMEQYFQKLLGKIPHPQQSSTDNPKMDTPTDD